MGGDEAVKDEEEDEVPHDCLKSSLDDEEVE